MYSEPVRITADVQLLNEEEGLGGFDIIAWNVSRAELIMRIHEETSGAPKGTKWQMVMRRVNE